MAEPPLATYEDVVRRMSGPAPSRDRAEAFIDDASALIHQVSEYVWIDADGELVADVPGVARAVCCAAVRRSLENPRGVIEQGRTIDNYSDRERFANESSDVYLKKAEIVRIRQAAGKTGIGTISTTRGPLETPAVLDRYPFDPDTDTIPWL